MRGGGGVGLGRLDLAPDPLHGPHPVAFAVRVFGPARGVDARSPVQRVDAQAAVVGERGKTAEVGCLARLQFGVVDEGDAGLLGLRQAELLGADAARFRAAPSSARISRSLPALWVAMTSLSPIGFSPADRLELRLRRFRRSRCGRDEEGAAGLPRR